ncbi:MAG: ferrochelatase [Cryomorphaceae bacterium]|nr:ferrochelatase [Cryomorphaceae bacterium]
MGHKKALLLINLGSPDSTKVKDVKSYLDEFLMDERVIDFPYWKRLLLVRGIILNFRPKKSAAAYKSIWWKEGSPLVVLNQRLAKKVDERCDYPVALAMRYGNPSIKDVIGKLILDNPQLERLQIVPLYPQYAMSTYETVVEKVLEVVREQDISLQLEWMPPFYNDEDYLKLLAEKIRPSIEEDYDKILFSYHGVPERHIKKGDVTGEHCLQCEDCCNVPSDAHAWCYRHQCYNVTKSVCQILNIPEHKVVHTFQSRLGRDPWLQPYTDKTLEALGKEGVQKLLIVCPAFVTDCLETLEEIQEEGMEIFQHAGGGEFKYIPCLNDDNNWADLIAEWAGGKVRFKQTESVVFPIDLPVSKRNY